MTPSPLSRALPYAMAAATVLFWSGNYILGRAVIDEFPPIALAFWRWLLAWVLLMPLPGGRCARHGRSSGGSGRG